MHLTPHDVRVAFRSMGRRPGLAAVAVITMSLGIGAATSVFSVVNGVLLTPPAFPEPDRLVRLHMVDRDRGRAPWSGANFVDLVEGSTSFTAVCGYRLADYSMPTDRFPVVVGAASVTTNFFRVFGIQTQLGRGFSTADDNDAGEDPVVLGNAFWESRFAADPDIIGRVVDLNGATHTVVGVMPPGFDFPDGVQLWVASPYRVPEFDGGLAVDPATDRSQRYFRVVARLADGASPASARQEGATIMARIAAQHPDSDRNVGFDIERLHDDLIGEVRPALLVLFGAVGLLLLIACVNVANLLLAQATSRVHEMAVRKALGAGRWRIARQLLTESAILGISGALGGVLLASWGTRWLLRLAASELPRAAEVSMSLPVLVFALAAALLTSLLFGLVPVLWLDGHFSARALHSRSDPSTTADRTRLRSVLVTVEIALSLALLIGAGLLLRTYTALGRTDPGFSPDGVLTARVWLTGGRTPSDDEIRAFQDQLLERVRALPGVTSAGMVLSLPIGTGISAQTTFSVEGRPVEQGTEPGAGLQAASPGYFETMKIPILGGRTFATEDGPKSVPVAVVSAAFAEKFFPGEDPIGRRIGSGNPAEDDFQWLTVIGVVGNTRYGGLDSEPRVEAYECLAQSPWSFAAVVLRAGHDPNALADPIREVVSDLSPLQPVQRIATMSELLHLTLARQRFSATLLGLFAALALLLAAIGLYGVMSFVVAQRQREMGLRIAIGATPSAIVQGVMLHGSRLLAFGIGAGLLGALAFGRFIRSVLYGVAPTDPTAIIGAVATLGATALLALVLPARRAARIDPAVSLRAE